MPSNVAETRREVRALIEDVGEAQGKLKEFERVTFRTLALVRRFTGVEQIDAGITKCMRMITIMRQVQMTAHLAMVASGPLGWALMLVGAVSTAVSASDLMMSLGE